jgi:serine/threonine protein phosphatase PrpC
MIVSANPVPFPAQRLALEALARGSADNVAVAVAFLNGDGSTGRLVRVVLASDEDAVV